jgi:hypothetical protein
MSRIEIVSFECATRRTPTAILSGVACAVSAKTGETQRTASAIPADIKMHIRDCRKGMRIDLDRHVIDELASVERQCAAPR